MKGALLQEVKCRQCGRLEYVLLDGGRVIYISKQLFNLLNRFFNYAEMGKGRCNQCLKQEEEKSVEQVAEEFRKSMK